MQHSSTSNGRLNTASSSTSPLVGERGHGDEVQVVEVNFSAVAQRRLARHARRARLARVPAALMVDECVDVEGMGTVPSSVDVLSDDSDEPVVTTCPGHSETGSVWRRTSSPFPWLGADAWTNAAHSARDGQDSRGGSRARRREVVDRVRAFSGSRSRRSRSRSPRDREPFSVTSFVFGRPEAWMPPIAEASVVDDNDVASASVSRGTLGFSRVASSGAHAGVCFYVEPVLPGMEPRCCALCGEVLAIGQLRLGFAFQCSTSSLSPMWAHASQCLRRARVVLSDPVIERVSFSPIVPAWDRQRTLDDLSRLPRRSGSDREERSTVRPWRFLPASLQHWAVRPVPESPPALSLEPMPIPRPPPSAGLGRTTPGIPRNLNDVAAMQFMQFIADFANQPSDEGQDASALAAHLLDAVPVEVLVGDAEEPCPICREVMKARESVRRLPCFHVFHQSCIDKWLTMKGTCPLDNCNVADMISQQDSLIRNSLPTPPQSTTSQARPVNMGRLPSAQAFVAVSAVAQPL